MKYQGVAHHIAANPEIVALYRHGKSFRFLAQEHQAGIMSKSHVGDLAISPIKRDDPAQALDDAHKLCEAQGLEPGYAMIKREDGQYFTDAKQALLAALNG